MNKILLLLAFTFIGTAAYAVDLEDCSQDIRNKMNQVYTCIYGGPTSCNLDVSEEGKNAGMDLFAELAEATSEFTCDEYDEAATTILDTIQGL